MGRVKRVALFFVLLVLSLIGVTQVMAWRTNVRFPADGEFVTVEGVRLHFYDLPADPGAGLLPLVFLHGASGNARDLRGAFGQSLGGKARLIFVDRPGAGHSMRGTGNMAAPDEQARLIAGLLDALQIKRAIVVGHSLGAAVAVAFALDHKRHTAGLVLISPATHPWPGGGVSWHYDMTNFPVLGRLFSETAASPFGQLMYSSVIKGVFAPDPVAQDYQARSGTQMVLRPASFRYNAQDVGSLHANVTRLAPRYSEISVPTTIITGDSDDVVRADIHSQGLLRDIAGAKLVWLKDGGHMPTYAATDKIIAEIIELDKRITVRE